MNVQDFINQLLSLAGGGVLNLLAALGILIVGWIVALIGAAIVRGVLRRTALDDRLATAISGDAAKLDVEKWAGRGVFYLIMLFVLVAFFQTLNLTAVTEPLNALLGRIFEFLPQLVGAGLILLVAWIIASVIKFAIARAAQVFKLDERLGEQAGLEEAQRTSISESLATAAFWLIFLLFLPAVLSTLGMQGLVAPVQQMFGEILAIVPNILGAGIILLVGWFIARIVRQIVANLLAVAGADRLGERIGLRATGDRSLSNLVGTIVYALILIPTVVAALNTLQIEGISGPASAMLTNLLNAVPAIFGAALVLGLAYVVGRLVAGLVTNVLTGLGFNRLPVKLGLGQAPAEGQRTPAEITGIVTVVAIMLFAAIEAANLLGFGTLAAMIANFTAFGGQAILALVIFGIGLYLANLAQSVILSTAGERAAFGATIARLAILVFAGAMALRQFGVADDIINLAFGILLGTLGVAAALAIGLGSREIAGREVERWLQRVRQTQDAGND